jgi:hypothetical protein
MEWLRFTNGREKPMRYAVLPLLPLFLCATQALAQDVVSPSNADLMADLASFNDKTVAISPCDMMVMDMSGQYSCRLVDESGEDLKDANGLPVDIFITIEGIDQASIDWLKGQCDEYGLCDAPVRITGPLAVSEGTLFPLMSKASITALGQ